MIFDGHSDILTDLTIRYAKGDKDPFNNIHKESLKRGGVHGGICVIWPEPPHCDMPYHRSKEILSSLSKEIDKGNITLARNYDEFMKTWGKKFTIFLGAEGLSSIENNLEFLDELHENGLRISSLTWNESNGLATGVSGDKGRGLTPLGANTVKRLEALNILLDVSHLNEKSFWDIAKIVTKPIIASHSNLRRLSDHPRNLTDDQVRFITQTGGLIGINAYKDFVSVSSRDQNVDGYVRHIVETANLVGIEHVAIGFDFFNYLEGDTIEDFASESPHLKGMEDVSKAMIVVEAMKGYGFTQENIDLVCHKNFFRVIKEAVG